MGGCTALELNMKSAELVWDSLLTTGHQDMCQRLHSALHGGCAAEALSVVMTTKQMCGGFKGTAQDERVALHRRPQ